MMWIVWTVIFCSFILRIGCSFLMIPHYALAQRVATTREDRKRKFRHCRPKAHTRRSGQEEAER